MTQEGPVLGFYTLLTVPQTIHNTRPHEAVETMCNTQKQQSVKEQLSNWFHSREIKFSYTSCIAWNH